MKQAIVSLILAASVGLGHPAVLKAEEAGMPSETKPEARNADPALAAIDAFIASQKIDREDSRWRQLVPEPPQQSFDAAKRYLWKLETNQGPLVIRLLPDVAPMHVTSTIYLTRLGFYDGIKFHRVIPGFMAQGGDPTGSGGGGPGYKYAGEFSPKAHHDKRGILSMANAGPNTDGSQFFITFTPTPHLDGRHTVFGELVDGEETLAALEQRGSPSGRPSERLEITRATIAVE